MSTRFTIKSPLAGFDLVDSRSLALTMATGGFRDRVAAWLLGRLEREGFEGLTGRQLVFLSALNCGPNHASNLARGLGISRQAVHKVVRELERAGWLTTETDSQLGNQRVIRFTVEGERMMALARQNLSELDNVLLSKFGDDGLETVSRFLDFDPSAPSDET